MSYNGHKNWDYWNVALWIGNDEGLYNMAREYCRQYDRRTAARLFVQDMEMDDRLRGKTPDGARFTQNNVRAAMVGLE